MAPLHDEIHQTKPFASPAEATYLNLQRTANHLLQGFTHLLRRHTPGRRGLSPSQYNVLRILRGAHPDAMTCGEISDRLVTPGPDVTRLVDRLAHHDWAERDRDAGDRRIVRTRITAAGLDLLADLDEPVATWLDTHLGHLSEAEHTRFGRLLEKARRVEG